MFSFLTGTNQVEERIARLETTLEQQVEAQNNSDMFITTLQSNQLAQEKTLQSIQQQLKQEILNQAKSVNDLNTATKNYQKDADKHKLVLGQKAEQIQKLEKQVSKFVDDFQREHQEYLTLKQCVQVLEQRLNAEVSNLKTQLAGQAKSSPSKQTIAVESALTKKIEKQVDKATEDIQRDRQEFFQIKQQMYAVEQKLLIEVSNLKTQLTGMTKSAPDQFGSLIESQLNKWRDIHTKSEDAIKVQLKKCEEEITQAQTTLKTHTKKFTEHQSQQNKLNDQVKEVSNSVGQIKSWADYLFEQHTNSISQLNSKAASLESTTQTKIQNLTTDFQSKIQISSTQIAEYKKDISAALLQQQEKLKFVDNKFSQIVYANNELKVQIANMPETIRNSDFFKSTKEVIQGLYDQKEKNTSRNLTDQLNKISIIEKKIVELDLICKSENSATQDILKLKNSVETLEYRQHVEVSELNQQIKTQVNGISSLKAEIKVNNSQVQTNLTEVQKQINAQSVSTLDLIQSKLKLYEVSEQQKINSLINEITGSCSQQVVKIIEESLNKWKETVEKELFKQIQTVCSKTLRVELLQKSESQKNQQETENQAELIKSQPNKLQKPASNEAQKKVRVRMKALKQDQQLLQTTNNLAQNESSQPGEQLISQSQTELIFKSDIDIEQEILDQDTLFQQVQLMKRRFVDAFPQEQQAIDKEQIVMNPERGLGASLQVQFQQFPVTGKVFNQVVNFPNYSNKLF